LIKVLFVLFLLIP